MSKSKASANRSVLEYIFEFFYSHEYCTIQIIFKLNYTCICSWLKNWRGAKALPTPPALPFNPFHNQPKHAAAYDIHGAHA